MPTKYTQAQRDAFAERFKAGWLHFGYGQHGKQIAFAKQYGVRAPSVIGWLKAKNMPSPTNAREFCRDWECDPNWMLFGDGAAPSWYQAAPGRKLFTRERRAGNDVIAAHIAIESLVEAVLRRVPGSAAAFLEDLKQSAEENEFPIVAGLLLNVSGIAEEVQADEAADVQRQQRKRSGGGKTL
jgi:hypothetical protein